MSRLVHYERQESCSILSMDDGKMNVISSSMFSELTLVFLVDRPRRWALALHWRARPKISCQEEPHWHIQPAPAWRGARHLCRRRLNFDPPGVRAVSGDEYAS